MSDDKAEVVIDLADADAEPAVGELVEDAPPPPEKSGGPPADHPHRALWQNVKRALYALPPLFDTQLRLAGIRATDLHTLNSTLGSSIEQSVVDILNDLRDIWDPVEADGNRRYQDASFVRQSQTWPDVLLQTGDPDAPPIMGIELKGWFVLSKEGEPSFRYKVNEDVCTPLDLIAVYPWWLDQVVSGTPRLLAPYIEEARYAAQMRNHYWRFGRRAKGEGAEITPAHDREAYPRRGKKFSDTAKVDPGGNFGRASRARIMDGFINTTFEEDAAGIPIKAWQAFFQTFRESVDLTTVTSQIRATQSKHAEKEGSPEERQLATLLGMMLDYAATVSGRGMTEAMEPIVGAGTKITVIVPAAGLVAHESEDDPLLLPIAAQGLTLPVMVDRVRWKRMRKTIVDGAEALRLTIGVASGVFLLEASTKVKTAEDPAA